MYVSARAVLHPCSFRGGCGSRVSRPPFVTIALWRLIPTIYECLSSTVRFGDAIQAWNAHFVEAVEVLVAGPDGSHLARSREYCA